MDVFEGCFRPVEELVAPPDGFEIPLGAFEIVFEDVDFENEATDDGFRN